MTMLVPLPSAIVAGFSTAFEPWTATVWISSGGSIVGTVTPTALWLAAGTGCRPKGPLPIRSLVTGTDGSLGFAPFVQPAMNRTESAYRDSLFSMGSLFRNCFDGGVLLMRGRCTSRHESAKVTCSFRDSPAPLARHLTTTCKVADSWCSQG